MRSRSSPNTSAALAPFMCSLAATSGSSARRNTLAFFSSPSSDGNGRLVVGAQSRHFRGARLQRGIVGVDGERELDVRGRIFVAAIELEIVRQRAQLQQRVPHHRMVALEHAAAADREQRVGGEQRLLAVEHVGDVVERMARRLQHARQQVADLDDVAIGGAQIDIGDLRGLVVRGDDAAAIFLLQLGDAADMVVMMMGDQDVGERPALALQRLDDGAGFRRVDRGGRLRRGVMDQIAEIVGQAGEGADFGGHDVSIVT